MVTLKGKYRDIRTGVIYNGVICKQEHVKYFEKVEED